MVVQCQGHCQTAGTTPGTCLGLTGRLTEPRWFSHLPFWVSLKEALSLMIAHWLQAGDGQRLAPLRINRFSTPENIPRRLDRHCQPRPRGERVGYRHIQSPGTRSAALR